MILQLHLDFERLHQAPFLRNRVRQTATLNSHGNKHRLEKGKRQPFSPLLTSNDVLKLVSLYPLFPVATSISDTMRSQRGHTRLFCWPADVVLFHLTDETECGPCHTRKSFCHFHEDYEPRNSHRQLRKLSRVRLTLSPRDFMAR